MSERAPGRPPRPCLPVAFWALVAVLGVERAALAADLDQGSLLGPAALLLVAGVALGCAGARARTTWAESAAVVLVAAAAALGASAVELAGQRALSARLASTPVSACEIVLESDMSEGASGWRGRARVSVDASGLGEVWLLADEPLAFGSTVRVVGRYEPSEEGAWGASSRAQGLAGEVRVLRVLDALPADGVLGALVSFRERVLASLEPISSDARALLAGSVCASTTAMGERGLDETFAACGISHLVAVSGGHLAMVTGALSAALFRTRLRPPARLAVLLAASGAFVLFCAAPSSAVRAWAMSLVAGASELMGRRVHPLSSVSVVGAFMALADPGVSGQLGFLLSVACVCGICALGSYARYLVRVLLPGQGAWRRLGRVGKVAAGALRTAGDALSMTIVAQLVTMPFVCAAFSQLSLVAPLANVVLAPAFSVLLAGGLAAAALVWAPPAQSVALALCDAVGEPLVALARALERLPLACVAVSVDEGPALLALAGLLVLLLVLWPRATRARVALAVCVPLALGAGWVLRGRFFSPACVCVLDVGQGDAVLVTDGAASLLVDTGPSGAIAPALARRGVTHLDAVLVTHLHADHTGGLAEVRALTGCERVYVAEGVAGAEELAVGAEVIELAHGDVLRVGSFELEVVSPVGPVDGTENDHSVELSLSYDEGGRSLTALLAGDAERDTTGAAVERGDVGEVDLLKVGHHGSEASVTPELARALGPEVAVASAGEGNGYGHPDPACVEALEHAGAEFLCTMDVGDVCVEPGAVGPVVTVSRGWPA